tara:strand:+ start:119 stop:496 length:378 start_codon:yes stop_codon:yes gene_type:complete
MVMARICLGGIVCLLGFWVFNFLLGKVFLGDAGAYAIGHVIAWIGILIIARNPSLATFSVLLVFFWPLTEMAHAIVRRKLKGETVLIGCIFISSLCADWKYCCSSENGAMFQILLLHLLLLVSLL